MVIFHEYQYKFVISLSFLLRMRKFFRNVVEEIKKSILYSVTSPENCTIYEVMWKRIVEPDKPQMTIWRVRIAHWVTKTTDTHSEYVIVIDFT
jgi:hypothetical protein